MATAMYMVFTASPTIQGEVTTTGFTNAVEVLSWSHGFTQATSPTRSTAGGGTVSLAMHSDLTFTKYIDKATDGIIKACWTGDQISKIVLSCVRSDGGTSKGIVFLEVEMDDVIVSGYSTGGGQGDLPTENITLAYGKVTYTYKQQKSADGTAGPQVASTHDLIKNIVS